MTADAKVVADQLGLLLQRRVRRTLYDEVIHDVHPAVDAAAYPVLSGIARHGAVSAAALGAEIGLDRSLVSRRAALLADAGLLRTRTDPDDRRATLLVLTEDGEQVVAALRRRLVTTLDDRLRDWSAGDRHQLAQLLIRLVIALGDGADTTTEKMGRRAPTRS